MRHVDVWYLTYYKVCFCTTRADAGGLWGCIGVLLGVFLCNGVCGCTTRYDSTLRGALPYYLCARYISCSLYTPCAIACINICAHVKDPAVVRVKGRWIMEALKHQASPVGWVAWLCRGWLSPGKAIRFFHGRNSNGTRGSQFSLFQGGTFTPS